MRRNENFTARLVTRLGNHFPSVTERTVESIGPTEMIKTCLYAPQSQLWAYLMMGWEILNDQMYAPHGAYSVLVGK